ncbi:MAG: 16S rRNA (cytosine(967)-C(5))-methyltransferase RsmB, partial [Clostridia bacterium]|nr:16S rRNA (cytosine(967)-C(5))-methyltransferase RsmB [Clostridia bacterium]
QPGEVVVDTCASPGGKSFSAAIDMKNEGRVYSFDLHANKTDLIARGAARLGLRAICASCRDAADPDPALAGKADRVICDAPCSGLGVMSKKPDIKYKSVSDIERLPEVQFRVLSGAGEYVKQGGVIVYSTCTLNPDENERVVERFLSSRTDFALVPFDLGAVASEGMLTLMPYEYGTDGFFIAKMKKI